MHVQTVKSVCNVLMVIIFIVNGLLIIIKSIKDIIISLSLTVHSQQTFNFLKLPLLPLNQNNLFLNYWLFTPADRHHTGKGQSESGTQPKQKQK